MYSPENRNRFCPAAAARCPAQIARFFRTAARIRRFSSGLERLPTEARFGAFVSPPAPHLPLVGSVPVMPVAPALKPEVQHVPTRRTVLIVDRQDRREHLRCVPRHVVAMPAVLRNDLWVRSDRIPLRDPKVEIIVFTPAQLFVVSPDRQENIPSKQNGGMHAYDVSREQGGIRIIAGRLEVIGTSF